LDETPFLDEGYTAFGQVVEGMDVVESIERDDVIGSITIEER
jgi:cyclophilin family peptidyl-prolyl cis-trans isomerase